MTKETLSARISGATYEELEEYAEERGMSKSEATDRLVEKALKIENGDVEIVPVSTDGGTTVEDALKTQSTEIQKVNEQIESVSSSITENRLLVRAQNVALLVGFFWVYLQLQVGTSVLVTVLTGLPLIALLIYPLLKRHEVI